MGCLMVDVLVGVLLRGAWGSRVHSVNQDFEHPQDCGHFFFALSIEHFGTAETFGNEIEVLIKRVRSSRRAPGTDRIYVPGEIEWNKAEKYSREGIPLEANILVNLTRTAAELGVSAEALSLD